MYLCLAALSIGIFASCKAKKGVEATFSDLDGSWNIVELNGKVLNPAETNQVIEFDVARLHTFHVSHSFQDRIFDLHIRTSHHGSGRGVDRDGRNILIVQHDSRIQKITKKL